MTLENLTPPEPTLEEVIVPYIKRIEKLKTNISELDDDFTGIHAFLDFRIDSDRTEFITVAALFEEYDLLSRYFAEIESLRRVAEQIPSVADMLNTHVSCHFSVWQPTPLYFITGQKARARMQDVNKMVHFLAAHGADVNIPAGDGSTPLWNMTNNDCPMHIMQTLLEIGADPNQIAIDEGCQWTPLCNCLRPELDENDEAEMIPFDSIAIEKAKLLLNYGADPNLVSPGFPAHPPLMMVIHFGDASQPELIELVELLLQKGADPNFNDTYTPLVMAAERNMKTIGELLILYGAKMPGRSAKVEQPETPKYETTFNYLLTHRVIPQLMFSDLKLFYEKILTSPDTVRQFMRKAVAHATALATEQSRYEPPYPIEDFKMGIYGKEGSDESAEENIIVIAFTRFWEACDCAAIAFPVSRVGYYTCEVAVDPVNSDVSYMLGGWEPSGSSFRHNNYGEMPMPLDPQVFIDRVIEIAYGKGENPPSANTRLVADRKPVKLSKDENAVRAYETGTRLMLDNQLDEAEKYLAEAVEHDPAFLEALDHLGIVYRRQGHFEKAEKVYLYALTLDDKNAVTYNNLALVYKQMNRMEDTVDMYAKVHEIDPENPESYFGMGALLQECGEYEKSKQYFHAAMEKYDQQKSNLIYNAFYNQGHNHFELKEYKEALYCYEQALKAYPDNDLLKERTAEIKEIIAERNASYPVAMDPAKVGSYDAHTCSGGGYFYDEVLEYRVWVHTSEGDDYEAFPSYEKALKFSRETQGAEEPLALVLQREHVNQREDGTYEHITGDRITEWRVEWLTEETKRNENAIREFLKQHNVAE